MVGPDWIDIFPLNEFLLYAFRVPRISWTARPSRGRSGFILAAPNDQREEVQSLFSVVLRAGSCGLYPAFYLWQRHFAGGAPFSFHGTLLFVCALMSALATGTPRWTRGLFLALCALMALYGLGSFSYHEMTTAQGQSLDRMSWTNQRIFDPAAIDFAREVYAREGRESLFVLPSYQMAVTLPARRTHPCSRSQL